MDILSEVTCYPEVHMSQGFKTGNIKYLSMYVFPLGSERKRCFFILQKTNVAH